MKTPDGKDANVPGKTPEEIKKALSCSRNMVCLMDACPYRDSFFDDQYGGCLTRLGRDSLAYIQQLEAQIPKWISVKERLPDKKQNVLYFVDGYGVRLGRYNYTGVTGVVWFTTRLGEKAGSAGSTTAATHWMPLPEPPEEG